jgi:hypothetical protein
METKRCCYCNGRGIDYRDGDDCGRCDGTGKLPAAPQHDADDVSAIPAFVMPAVRS